MYVFVSFGSLWARQIHCGARRLIIQGERCSDGCPQGVDVAASAAGINRFNPAARRSAANLAKPLPVRPQSVSGQLCDSSVVDALAQMNGCGPST
jgi:hypothetical protein